MEAEDTRAFSRTCPSCGRRVPAAVRKCRCGLELPEVTAAEAEPRRSPPSPLALAGQLLLIVALFYGAYRMMGPAPSTPATTRNLATPDSGLPAPPARGGAEPLPVLFPDPEPLPLAEAGSLEEVISRTMPAVVRVETPQGTGSAFFVRADTLITNRHVVTTNTEVTIRWGNGQSATAQVDDKGRDVDIAILKVTPSMTQKVIPMSSSARLRLGQEIILIGSPFGVLQNSVTRGIVSAQRVIDGVSVVQTDAAANPGNSGGPMLDRAGNVVGITTMSYKGAQGVNFATSIDHARAMLEGRGTGVKRQSAAPAEADDAPAAPPTLPVPDAETTRAAAERAYGQALDSIGSQADEFDKQWTEFRSKCYGGTINGSYQHEWFALLAAGAMPGTLGGGNCAAVLDHLKQVAGRFRDAMRNAEDVARRDGVFPGTLREARRSHRLEFDGWQ